MSDTVIPTNQREFRCQHCDGKILIPRNLAPITGPCPHCSGIITSPADDTPELPVAPVQVLPAPAVTPATPVAAVTAPPPEIPAEIPAALPPVKSKPVPKVDLPHRETPPVLNTPKVLPATNAPKRQRSGLISAMLVLLAILLVGGAGVYFALKKLGWSFDLPTIKAAAGDPAVIEADYIRTGWQQDAYHLLRGYLAATTTRDKIPFILNGNALAAKIEDFYGGSLIDDSDTPAEAFSVHELSAEDRKRGLFMMIYDQPPQLDITEFFRPLASLGVQYDLDEADLLHGTLARAADAATEPLRIHAFFKRTPQGLKLDWEIFAQTKYRTLQNFVDLPEVGQTGTFRVFIVEDVPAKGRAVAGTRTYRVVDTANTSDSARVNVKMDSETGSALSIINWRGTKENRPLTRTATVELKWSGAATAPELEISRFVCWEFLGLGGLDTPAPASTQ